MYTFVRWSFGGSPAVRAPVAGASRTSASRDTEKRASCARDMPADPAAALPRGAEGRDGRTGHATVSPERGPVTVLPSQLGRTTAARRAAGRTASLARARAPWRGRSRRIGLAEYPVYDPQTGVARDPWVAEAAMCVRLVDVRITCGLHDDAQIAAVFIDPRAK